MFSYVPLIDEGSQTFVASTPALAVGVISGGNVAVPTALRRGLAGQTRPAVILSVTEANGVQYANLAVFTDVGDPFRGSTVDEVVRVLRVPYSDKKEPGTFHRAEPIQLGSSTKAGAKTPVTKPSIFPEGFNIDTATNPQLIEHANGANIDLKGATRKEDLQAAIRAHYEAAAASV